MHAQPLSHVLLVLILWTADSQATLSMELLRQEYWSGLQFPTPGDLPDPGIKLGSLALQAESLPAALPRKEKMSLDLFPW